MLDKDALGKRIAELRKMKGMTQNRFAELVGIKQTTLSKYENGEHEPSATILVEMADVLETSTDHLLRGIEPNNDEIYRKTGLSEAAIENLGRLHDEDEEFAEWMRKNKSAGTLKMDAVNKLLSSQDTLNALIRYLNIRSDLPGYYYDSIAPHYVHDDVLYLVHMSPDVYAIFLKDYVCRKLEELRTGVEESRLPYAPQEEVIKRGIAAWLSDPENLKKQQEYAAQMEKEWKKRGTARKE